MDGRNSRYCRCRNRRIAVITASPPEGKLWELRAKAADGIARGIYVTTTGRRVVVLHVFVKKTQKTPRSALETARERMKSVMP